MKTTRLRTPAKTPYKTQRSRPNSNTIRDPVQVYCRVRPMQSDGDLSCLRVVSATTVVLTPPEIAINYKIMALRETQYIFSHVFDVTSEQREVFNTSARPLVENLLQGKNGLLFTYGVTGSGKTYTMTGDARDRGIMPRCLDILFRTISDYQTKKCVFKPDLLNGFEILSDADAHIERQSSKINRFVPINRANRKDSDPEIASRASTEVSALSGVIEDNMYTVFISYVEVYNNSVYDLLEEGTTTAKTLQSKIIREDSSHNMYVHGVSEIEVKTIGEAIEAYQFGQKRKRMGHTILNAESSRSHSVFTIRLVQAPTDSQGENILMDKRTCTVSQLSLVDLAGSERTNRTKNTGTRLREAGNINNSLMTLRTCLEILRENQTNTQTKMVPYRDSKITHLFKNYFDGEGQVRMIVCVNPRAEDYDETAQVMKFAEMTQEVQVTRPPPPKIDAGLTPGRRKANQLFKMAVNNLEEQGRSEAKKLELDLNLVYSLGPPFPDFKLNSPEADHVIRDLMHHLEQRIKKRQLLLENFNSNQDKFRMHLMQLEKENQSVKTENLSLKAILKQERQKITSYENKIIIHENSIDDLNRRIRERDTTIAKLQDQLGHTQQTLSRCEQEKDKIKRKYATQMAVNTDKMSKQLENKLKEQKSMYQDGIREKEEKLKMVADIINMDHFHTLKSKYETASQQTPMKDSGIHDTPRLREANSKTPRGVPVASLRHRRSRSEDRWIEHRAPNPVPLGTIFQPHYKNRKSITKLTDMKDITQAKTSKYCLVSQEADTDGEVETRLYKANVIPTTGGGAQVVFNDIELLKQTSPLHTPHRNKRPSDTEIGSPRGTTVTSTNELASKCSVGIEGHSKKQRI